MLNSLIAMAMLIGVVSMVIYTPSLFYRGIKKMDEDLVQLPVSEVVKSFIPIYNVARAEWLYTGRVSYVFISTLALIASIVFRCALIFIVPMQGVINYISIALFLVAVLMCWVANIYIVRKVLMEASELNTSQITVDAVLFPLGQYYIGTYLPTIVRNVLKKQETFKC